MISKDKYNNIVEFSINTLDEFIKAKKKGVEIIESCLTNHQLDNAKKYVENYSEKTRDLIGTSELQLLILEKRKKVGDNKFTKRDWNKLIKSFQKNA
tara:strand:+ start:528 stop:818 length:291 start_codon:yes stop_codon:yes gene_type:complete